MKQETEVPQGLKFARAREHMDFVVGCYISLWLDLEPEVRQHMRFQPSLSMTGVPYRLLDTDGSIVAELEYKSSLFVVKWVRSVTDFLAIDSLTQSLEAEFYD